MTEQCRECGGMNGEHKTDCEAMKPRRSSSFNRLVSFFSDRINCFRGKHKWERRQLNFELDGQVVLSQMGYGCTVCDAYVRDCDITEEKLTFQGEPPALWWVQIFGGCRVGSRRWLGV